MSHVPGKGVKLPLDIGVYATIFQYTKYGTLEMIFHDVIFSKAVNVLYRL